MRICAVQHDIVWASPEGNRQHLAPLIAEAAGGGAELVLLSEMFSTGFVTGRSELDEAPDGPTSSWMSARAAEHGIWVAGSIPEVVDGATYNTLIVAGPTGQQHRYRKIHRFAYGGEDRVVSAGDKTVTVEIGGLRISLFVCYDIRFADYFWELAPETDVYLVPANWPADRRLHWQTLLRARAIENQAYVVGCNRVGAGGKLNYVGDSTIIDPMGEVLAYAADGEQLIYAEVNADRVREVRERLPFLKDR